MVCNRAYTDSEDKYSRRTPKQLRPSPSDSAKASGSQFPAGPEYIPVNWPESVTTASIGIDTSPPEMFRCREPDNRRRSNSQRSGPIPPRGSLTLVNPIAKSIRCRRLDDKSVLQCEASAFKLKSIRPRSSRRCSHYPRKITDGPVSVFIGGIAPNHLVHYGIDGVVTAMSRRNTGAHGTGKRLHRYTWFCKISKSSPCRNAQAPSL